LQDQKRQNIDVPHNYPGFTTAQQPRVGITWYEAYAYCQWRGARLPTEAEWEYAARGPNSPIYPWGDTFDGSKVVYAGNSGNMTAAVGSKPSGASWVGALDMSGNVWQWTSSARTEYDSSLLTNKVKSYGYPYDPNDGRENPNDTNASRVPRGGSWNLDSYRLRAAVRGDSGPFYVDVIVEVRCASSALSTSESTPTSSTPVKLAAS